MQQTTGKLHSWADSAEQNVLLCSTHSDPEGLYKCCNVNAALARRQLCMSVPSVAQITGWSWSSTHTHTRLPVLPAMSFQRLLLLFFQDHSVSPVQRVFLITRLLLYYTWLPPSSFSRPSLLETLNRTLSFSLSPSASLYLPHSLLRRALEVVLLRRGSNEVSRKKKEEEEEAELDAESLFTLDLWGELGPFAPDWTFISFNWPR